MVSADCCLRLIVPRPLFLPFALSLSGLAPVAASICLPCSMWVLPGHCVDTVSGSSMSVAGSAIPGHLESCFRTGSERSRCIGRPFRERWFGPGKCLLRPELSPLYPSHLVTVYRLMVPSSRGHPIRSSPVGVAFLTLPGGPDGLMIAPVAACLLRRLHGEAGGHDDNGGQGSRCRQFQLGGC